MKNPVIIKGDKKGIHIIVDPMATLEEVLINLELRLKCTKSDFKNSKPINISFEGKELTDEEKKDILFVLNKIGLNVYHSPSKQQKINPLNVQADKDGLFYIGNLKNGQSINAICSIVVIGNVEKGASIYSRGNIVITGYLDGIAKAGCDGNDNSFVFSLISGRNI